MTTASYNKTSLQWQLQQLGQRIGEWIELKFSSRDQGDGPYLDDWPDWGLPSWMIQTLFWLLVATALIWLIWQVWPRFAPSFRALQRRLESRDRPRMATERSVSMTEWLNRAQALQRQGNYPEACQALYMAMLQQLHERGIAPHQPSRTDGEYRNLVQGLAQPSAYETLLNTHEQIRFGGSTLTAAEFERCQRAYREIAP